VRRHAWDFNFEASLIRTNPPTPTLGQPRICTATKERFNSSKRRVSIQLTLVACSANNRRIACQAPKLTDLSQNMALVQGSIMTSSNGSPPPNAPCTTFNSSRNNQPNHASRYGSSLRSSFEMSAARQSTLTARFQRREMPTVSNTVLSDISRNAPSRVC
jgi:hypothetical protein